MQFSYTYLNFFEIIYSLLNPRCIYHYLQNELFLPVLCRAGLLVINPVILDLNIETASCFLIMTDSFAAYNSLGWHLWSFSTCSSTLIQAI